MDRDRTPEEARKMAEACDKTESVKTEGLPYAWSNKQNTAGQINAPAPTGPNVVYRLERVIDKMSAQAETAQALARQAFYLTQFCSCLPRVLSADQQRGLEVLLSRAGF